jgi:glycosyltransferase involved in cell wall biosynthesis
MNNPLETTGGTSPLISIVTPVLNEEAEILGFLDHLAGLQGPFELIIVDGGSTDATRALIRDHAGKIPVSVNLLSAPKGRSTQMNAGAAAARGELLLFLHADCRIPADSLGVIFEACRVPGVCGGAFTQDCGDDGLFPTVSCKVAGALAAWSRKYFGDFGIFVKRDVFFAAGGFPVIPFCEDIEFCRSARRFGRMVQIDRFIQSSPRRFERVGRTKLTAVYILATVLNEARIRPVFLMRYVVD